LTNLIGSNRASKIGRSYETTGSRDPKTGKSRKIRGSRGSSHSLCLPKRGGHFKKSGSRNARTDIGYITLGRGVEMSTLCLKTDNL
jgi:hypothetical protein